MYPRHHVLLGFVFSLILFIFCEKISLLAAIIIFLSSFLIDIDHYLFLAWKLNKKNLFKAYAFGMKLKKKSSKLGSLQKKKMEAGFYIFHGIEALIILFLLGFFVHSFFYLVLLGFAFHLVLDHIEIFFLKFKVHKISVIFDFLCFRKANKNFKK